MQRRSLPSAKVTFADQHKLLEQIRTYVQSTVRKRPEVRKVVLFGSYATDRYVPGSDVDLLWVIADSQQSLRDRIPQYTPDSMPIPVDVFAYTVAELEKMIRAGNPFIRRAWSEGKVLYEREQRGWKFSAQGASRGAVRVVYKRARAALGAGLLFFFS